MADFTVSFKKSVCLHFYFFFTTRQSHNDTDTSVFIGAFEAAQEYIKDNESSHQVFFFYCSMRKQYTKIHTDFELSICSFHSSVFMSLYIMQH